MISTREVLARLRERRAFAVEARRRGLVGAAKDDRDTIFFEWYKGWVPSHPGWVYNVDWRCWDEPPTEREMRNAKWTGRR